MVLSRAAAALNRRRQSATGTAKGLEAPTPSPDHRHEGAGSRPHIREATDEDSHVCWSACARGFGRDRPRTDPILGRPAESTRCPSKWGAGDERGSGNLMKPAAVLNAVKLIKTGEVIELAHVLGPACRSSARGASTCTSSAHS